MSLGHEFIVDAFGCDPAPLRDLAQMQRLLARVIEELDLRPVGEGRWHAFPGEGGVTGMYLLAESHLCCHTYPERGAATFNLYCCRPRPPWPWSARLAEAVGAREVTVREVLRGA